MNNVLTIDVEEAFHAANLAEAVDRASWPTQPSRVEIGMDRLLELLREHASGATCFVLGVVAERNPHLIRRLAENGLEIASHGYDHRQVTTLQPDEFRRDLERAERAIRDACGARVVGYRAPCFSLRRSMTWAFEILAERGYRYDSSLFPASHPEYGDRRTTPGPHRIQCAAGELVELPVSVLSVGRWRVPVAGGGYLRQMPAAVFRSLLRSLLRRSGGPLVLYSHPWEFDPEQPRLPLGRLRALRHYRGLRGTENKLRRILREHRFASVADVLADLRDLPREEGVV